MKIGVLGLGSIGHRHANNLLQLGHEVIGYDPRFENDSGTYPGFSRVDRDDVLCHADAFIIASPTTEHRKDLTDTLIVGKPTFLEKPIADTYCSIRAFQVAMVGYNLRFHGAVKKAKEWLPKIGKPIWANFVCAQFNEKPIYRRDGVTLNWSHEIDLALYLLGHGRCTSASINETDSLADINILHTSGCRTSVHLDYLTKPEQRYFKIVGDEGTIEGQLAPDRECWLWENGCRAENFLADDSYDTNYVEEMQAFFDRIDGKETIGATWQDGLDVLEVCMDAKMGHWRG